jgi:transposase
LLKGKEPASATLVKRKNGDYYIHITLDEPTNPITETDKVLGIDYRQGKKFSCSRCGNHCDADYNGAKNIEALRRIIDTPRGSGLSCNLKTDMPYIQLSLFDSLGLPKTPVSA